MGMEAVLTALGNIIQSISGCKAEKSSSEEKTKHPTFIVVFIILSVGMCVRTYVLYFGAQTIAMASGIII